VGDDLLKDNYPQIHAVGRAAPKGNEPRLIDMTWGTQGYAL
jgi:leucyl aminopeptidase